MAQKITGYVKLQIPAGKATPAPPVGPALGQHGVNIAAFTKEFNERTKVATISKASVQKIAEMKMRDLNASTLESAMSMIAGTARSMGVVVEE